MKKARMNISYFRFILFNLQIFGEIVTTKQNTKNMTTKNILQEFNDLLVKYQH